MPNERRGVGLWVEHRLALPACCPVSGNPRPGSQLAIRYRAGESVLEVYALKRFIERFVGGHPDGTRNMEAMIQQIAQVAANTLSRPVRCDADLIIAPYQRLRLVCRARPNDLLPRDS